MTKHDAHKSARHEAMRDNATQNNSAQSERAPEHVERAHGNDFHASAPDAVKGLPQVHGFDFDTEFDFDKLIASYATTGAQASHLHKAIEIVREVRALKEKGEITVYLGYTSNMVSSGLRDVFRYLVQHRLVDVVVTTAGGVEEDIIKCIAPFYLGDFETSGARLREAGINRIGNILVPNDHYARFEQFLLPILHSIADEEERSGIPITPSRLADRLGAEIGDESSICYWAHKNSIPVFCPAIIDGSIGDIIYFFLYKRPRFALDTAGDVKRLNDITMEAKRTGLLLLGSGVVKHMILNTNMLRNGAEYAVYINNAQEFDASDAGARPDEAVSWGKILPDAKSVKVFGDATILFPLIVAAALR
jgi:deoxyhypusine synthase